MDSWDAGGLFEQLLGRNAKRRILGCLLVAFLVLGWVNDGLRDRAVRAAAESYMSHVGKRYDGMIKHLPVPTAPPTTTAGASTP